MSARHPRPGLVVWLAGLAAGLVVLHRAGAALPPPPLSEPGHVGARLAERNPAEAALSVLRVLALATGWYLMAVTLVGAPARWVRAGRLVRASDFLTFPAVRRLLDRAVGLSMAAAAFSGSAALAAQPDSPPPPGAETMVRLPDANATSPPVTMRRLPDQPPGPAPGVMERLPEHADDDGDDADDKAPTDASAPTPATWTVRPGDHFWSVAERTLAAAWKRAPSDAETGPYWRELVAANRPVLKDRDNPDLLFPGQLLTVPTPPVPPPAR